MSVKQINKFAITFVFFGIFLFNCTKTEREQIYRVTFNTGEGETILPQAVNSGEVLEMPPNPTRQGFIFTGWYMDLELTTLYDFSVPVNQNFTLYASWIESDNGLFTIYFDSNGGSEIFPLTVAPNSMVTQPEDPTRDGFEFIGWFRDDNIFRDIYYFSYPGNEDITIYAKWEINNYTITFDLNNDNVPSNAVIEYNQAVAEPSVPNRLGYTFDGWFYDQDFSVPYVFSIPPNRDAILYAKWSVKTYIVTFDTRGGGDISPEEVDSNALVKQPENPTRLGLNFERWYSDRLLTNPYDFSTPVTQNITLYANWITEGIDFFTVTFNTNGGTSLPIQNIQEGFLVTAPAPPPSNGHNGGSNLEGWYTDMQLTSKYDFNKPITSNIELYAKWNYIFSYDINERSITGLGVNFPDNVQLSFTIPSNINYQSVTTIADEAFIDNSKIKNLGFAEGIKVIGARAFSGCGQVSGDVVIPSSVTQIGDNAFQGMTSVNTFRFEANTPPSFGTNIFNLVDNPQISVPRSAVNDYRNAPNFNQYLANISIHND